MDTLCPKGFIEEDFKNRISGTGLMERWEVSLPEIQALSLQAYKEIIDKPSKSNDRMMNLFPEILRIKPFRPTEATDMQSCFYRLEDIERFEKEYPEMILNILILK